MANAVKYFEEGYNCAQSVFIAYCEDFGIDKQTGLKLASSFGGGMGRMREVCGAVSAMFAIAGLKHGYTSPNDDATKQKHYELIQQLAQKFKEKHGSIICRELLGENSTSPVPSKRTKEYYEERPCKEIIKTVCEIISEMD